VRCVLVSFSCMTTILNVLFSLVGLGMYFYALRKALVLNTSRCQMDAVYQICTCWAFVVGSSAQQGMQLLPPVCLLSIARLIKANVLQGQSR